MKRMTRNIDPTCARDLLEQIPRACICFACDHGPQAQPIMLVCRDNRYLAGIPLDANCRPNSGQEVVLLIDEGIHFFDLRAIYMRGRIKPAESPVDAPGGCAWFEIVPDKTIAWDYGALREVRDDN